MTHVSSPHRLHYPMQVPMGNKSQVNPDSYHTTRSLCDKHDCVSSLGNRTFRIISRVSYTHVLGFSPKGVNGPLFLCPTHIIYIYFYVLNLEISIGRRPKYELTTHSSTLMMNDQIHVHTPNMLMSLCICNANVTENSHVTCMMLTTWNILINHTSCQVPCNIYCNHTFHANLYRYHNIMHISIHQYMTKQVMSYSLP